MTLVTQLVECCSYEAKAVGSSPTQSIFLFPIKTLTGYESSSHLEANTLTGRSLDSYSPSVACCFECQAALTKMLGAPSDSS